MQRPYWAHFKVDLHVQCTCFHCEMEGKLFILIFSPDQNRGRDTKSFDTIFLLWSVMNIPILANSARSLCYKRWGRFFHFLWRSTYVFLVINMVVTWGKACDHFFSLQHNLMQGVFKYQTLQERRLIYIMC